MSAGVGAGARRAGREQQPARRAAQSATSAGPAVLVNQREARNYQRKAAATAKRAQERAAPVRAQRTQLRAPRGQQSATRAPHGPQSATSVRRAARDQQPAVRVNQRETRNNQRKAAATAQRAQERAALVRAPRCADHTSTSASAGRYVLRAPCRNRLPVLIMISLY